MQILKQKIKFIYHNIYHKYQWTPLHYAVEQGHIEVTKFLILKGANKQAQDSYGRTPRDNAKSDDLRNLF